VEIGDHQWECIDRDARIGRLYGYNWFLIGSKLGVLSMHAITFEADIVSEFLRIPNFEQFKNKHVRVVIEAEAVKTAPVRRLSALQLDTSNFKFDRNEANER
jgi:hypothetical protein